MDKNKVLPVVLGVIGGLAAIAATGAVIMRLKPTVFLCTKDDLVDITEEFE